MDGSESGVSFTLDQIRSSLLRPEAQDPTPQDRFAVRFPDGTTLAMLEKVREGKDPREAAVLGILSEEADGVSVLLTQRTDTVEEHRGQIAFPGGMREATDQSLLETALRETEEEVGIPPSDLEVMTALPAVYIWATNFVATPYFAIARKPLQPKANPQEVKEVFHVPLSHLANPDTIVEEEWTLRDHQVVVPFYKWGEKKIWGATARMLAMLMASL